MSPLPVLKAVKKSEYAELVALFFINAMGMGMWFVPLGSVLDAHGFSAIKSYAFATSGLAAFVSPLIFGAMADRHVSPVRVLRGLVTATAMTMMVVATAIQQGWAQWLVLALIQINALCMSPVFGLSTTIVLSRMKNSQRDFGPVRSAASAGWMAGCWLVSIVRADISTLAFFISAAAYLGVGIFSFWLPDVPPPKSTGQTSWKQRFGWDALSLLKNPDHRVMFLTAALFNIPLAAFYPHTPPYFAQLGFQHTSAWMSLGQVTEFIAMFLLAGLYARWRIKWIVAAGLLSGVLRFAFCAFGIKAWLLLGVLLHGCSYTLVFITGQIYLEERIDPTWRARAQALYALMTGGFGNMIGFLLTDQWFKTCTENHVTRWPVFWSGLAMACGVVLAYFLTAYRGRGARFSDFKPEERSAP